MQWEKFNKLEYLSETQDGANACIVLFHGYGADANDLAGLSGAFKFDTKVDWFFPQGIFEVPIGPMMSGRAWFQLRIADFENLASDRMDDNGLTPEITNVIAQVTKWLNHLGKLYRQVYIGGFSQGAILAGHSFYRLNFTPAGLILLSGFLVAPSAIPILPDPLKIPFFQSHGIQDTVLPISGGQKLFKKMTDLGMKGEWVEFRGAHEIPMQVILKLQTFLNSLLKAQE